MWPDLQILRLCIWLRVRRRRILISRRRQIFRPRAESASLRSIASMAATIPIQNSDLEFDNGTFDSAAFTAKALANRRSLAAVIDHSLVRPDATRQQVEKLCNEAAEYRFACAM